MAKRLLLRGGTTAEHSTFVGELRELTVDTTKKALVIHDGVTAGGISMPNNSDFMTHTEDTNNPHSVTKDQIGLGNADNTADSVKVVASAAKLTTARTIGGVGFDGSANINLPGVNTTGNQNTTGSAAKLTTARTIGGVGFDGSANIDLPGVNIVGNQNTTGSAAKLTTARTIGGVGFDGSANIDLPGVNTTGNQNTTGSAAKLTTARTINGTSFDGSANITTAKWGTPRTLTLTGDVTGSASIDGSDNITITTTAEGGGGGITGAFANLQTFTTSGTFTVPAGVTEVYAMVQSGGGGGGYANGYYGTATIHAYACGSGGCAALCKESVITVTPGQNITITIGAGGTSNANGGDSSFGTYLLCTGGSAGVSVNNDSGTSVNSIASPVSNIQQFKGGTTGSYNNGAPSIFGVGGANSCTTGTNTGRAGRAATNYGAGGGGAFSYKSATYAGGAGAPGIVKVYW